MAASEQRAGGHRLPGAAAAGAGAAAERPSKALAAAGWEPPVLHWAGGRAGHR